MNYKVKVTEIRSLEIEVDAKNERDAINTAHDAYMNSDYLQEQMLQDSALVRDALKVVEKDGYRLDEDGYVIIPQTLKIRKDELAKWEKMLLSNDIDYDKEGFADEECVQKWSAKFPDGREMDLRVCTNCREDKDVWSEAILYDADGTELAFSSVCDCLKGEWNLFDGDEGKHYLLKVISE